jgi:ATP-dependent Clp protease ATP-binding subunit ClpA
MLKQEFELARRQGIELKVTEPAKKWLLAQNDQPEFGARPLRRIIGRNLREPLADFLLTQQTTDDALIIVDAGEKNLRFDIQSG